MSIIRISNSNIENYSLFTYPTRTFVSSSSGITGSVSLFVRNSKTLKDSVPNEDYGESVLSATSLEELRQSAIVDDTRFYSHTTASTLAFKGPSGATGNAGNHDILDNNLFLTSSGMAVGYSLGTLGITSNFNAGDIADFQPGGTKKGRHYLVFSGSTTEYFDIVKSKSGVTIPNPDEKLRYVVCTKPFGGNYKDIFVSYIAVPGPCGHTENLTGSHPASALTNARKIYDGISTSQQRITSSAGVSLVQNRPIHSLTLQKRLSGSNGPTGEWIDVIKHEPTYKDFAYGKGANNLTEANVFGQHDPNFSAKNDKVFLYHYDESNEEYTFKTLEKEMLFNSASFTQGVEKVYSASLIHDDTHVSGANGPWYFRLVQSGTVGNDISESQAGWAIRNFKIQAKHASGSARNISGPMGKLLSEINLAPTSSTTNKKLEITRFEPSTKFTKDTGRKNTIKNILFPYYRSSYPSLNWGFTNYHTLNFFTASSVPSDTALIYPAGSGSVTHNETFSYSAPTGFTFQFYINPRYENHDVNDEFKAGTILHLSSSYCVSLITGSKRDLRGLVDSYKIMLQLSHSADIPPSSVGETYSGGNLVTKTLHQTMSGNLIFTSSDIPKNHWSHVGIRWGSSAGPIQQADYTGSFVINGKEDNQFIIPSSSIMPTSFENPQGDPDALFIGNYYDGPNNGSLTNTPLQARFFNANVSYTDGLKSMYPGYSYNAASQDATHTDIPASHFSLDHPLNAEIHEVAIYNKRRTVQEIMTSSLVGPEALSKNLMFYLPVFFVKESPKRNVLQTPFQDARTSTDDPFNAVLSFGLGARHINIPNFTREFVKKQYPRLYHLTASTVNNTTMARSANEFLYRSGSIIKSNLTILPNDNGKFMPNFDLLLTGTKVMPSPSDTPASGTLMDRFVSDTGVVRMDLVSLDNMISTKSIIPNFTSFDGDTGTIASELQGSTPEDPGLATGSILTILDRTRDPSSNEVSMFDMSNLFYGRRVMPETFEITDTKISGSDNLVGLTFKDNGYGSLYRSDCKSPHPKWATFGSIIYEEGIAIVSDPTAMHFGKDYFKANLTGERPVYIKEVNVVATAGSVNSSSNPNWTPLKPNDYEYENATEFVYITSVNLHDDNLNIVGRANLAQPLTKRDVDKYLIRLKMDY